MQIIAPRSSGQVLCSSVLGTGSECAEFPIGIFSRIFKKKNPFSADKEHLHHYMIINFNMRVSQVYIFLLNIIPFCLYQFYKSLYVIFATIAAYILIYILLFIKKKRNVN